MMRGVAAAALAMGVAVAGTSVRASAQTGGACGASGAPGQAQLLVQDACTKASDLFHFLAPQVGVALSGGNVMLGEGGALGGWGKRSVVLRVTAVDGRVPENEVSLGAPTGAVSADFGAQRAPVPVPSLDIAVGLYRGVPVGLTNVGGVDLLVGITAIPSVTRDQFRLEADGGGIAATLGARVGLLQESALVPGVALSVLQRRLPTTSVTYDAGNDTIRVTDTRVSSLAFRLTANKRFGLFAIGGGVGQDRLDARTSANVVLNETVQGQSVRAVADITELRDRTTRGTAFVNLSLGLALAQVVLEVGQSRAGDVRETLNTFGDRRANEAYNYGSVGFGFRF